MKAVDPSYYYKYVFHTIKKWKKIGDIIEPVMIQKSLFDETFGHILMRNVCLTGYQGEKFLKVNYGI